MWYNKVYLICYGAIALVIVLVATLIKVWF